MGEESRHCLCEDIWGGRSGGVDDGGVDNGGGGAETEA
eukprot:COSAG06_NODE_5021_length_3784_cov_35.777476_2_plen_38_part_00